MNTPLFAHAGQRAREILCTIECEREHVSAAVASAAAGEWCTTRDEFQAVREYSEPGRLKRVRETVTEKAIDRLMTGNVGSSWDEFAGSVADDAIGAIDLGYVFGFGWLLVKWIAAAAFRAFVWWAIRYFVRLAIEDVKRKLFGATLGQYGDLPPEQAVAMWGV